MLSVIQRTPSSVSPVTIRVPSALIDVYKPKRDLIIVYSVIFVRPQS